MRREQTEKILTKMGIDHQYEPFLEFTKIDKPASRDNMARPDRYINDDAVEQMATLISQGNDLEAIVVLTRPNKKLLIGDGLHRFTAAEQSHLLGMSAYLCNTPDKYKFDFACFLMNRWEGRGFTTEEIGLQCVRVYEANPTEVSVPDIARDAGISEDFLRTLIRCDSVHKRAQTLGLRLDPKTPRGVLYAAYDIHDDLPFKSALEFRQGAHKTVDQFQTLVKDIRAVRTGVPDQMAVIADASKFHDEVLKASSGRARGKLPVSVKIMQRLRWINDATALGVDKIELSALVASNRKQDRAAIEGAKLRLDEMLTEMDAIDLQRAGAVAA